MLHLNIIMSKTDDLLKACKSNIGNWTCAYCGSGSGQPAAIFRELKKRGYLFAEVSPNRWGKVMYCKVCHEMRTHYQLLSPDPVIESKPRISIDPSTRGKILAILNNRDAFTGATITSTPEIDHKTPWTRLKQDVDAKKLSDEEIIKTFQLLTREHNLLKDRACGKCKQTGKRTPFLEIPFWYKGNEEYDGICEGCGWYDGIEWRREIVKLIQHIQNDN